MLDSIHAWVEYRKDVTVVVELFENNISQKAKNDLNSGTSYHKLAIRQ